MKRVQWHVGLDDVGDARVSTVELPFRHDNGLYETLVFWIGHDLDNEMERYETESAARSGHARWVERVKEAQAGSV